MGCAALEIGGRGLLVRVGVGVASVAAGSAGLTLVFGLCAWVMLGGEPAYVGVSVRAPAVLPAPVPSAPPARVANLSNDTFASRWATDLSPTTTASFDDRFPSASPAPRTRSLQPPSTFSNRFAGAPGPRPAQFTLASVPATIQPAPAVAPAPHAAARALVARVAPNKHQEHQEPQERPAVAPYRVASLGAAPIRTAYASTDAGSRDGAIDNSLLKRMTPHDPPTTDSARSPT